MQQVFDPKSLLYHGTVDFYAKIVRDYGVLITQRSKGGVDFGPGFYLAVGQKDQAIQWAKYKAKNPQYVKEACALKNVTIQEFFKIKGSFKAVIMVFKIKDVDKWQKSRYKVFDKPSLNWKEFVFEGRQQKFSLENLDWVFGPLADGGLGQESAEQIREYDKGYNQLSIHNTETAQMLELLEVIPC